NAANTENVRYFIEEMKEMLKIGRGWLRISINDQEMTDEQFDLFNDNRGLIGASFIYGNKEEEEGCMKNIKKLRDLAKFIRFKRAFDPKVASKNMTPEKCVGRKFAHIIEADGTHAYCCQGRGLNGAAPLFCVKDCRWARVDLSNAWRRNPFS
ncbi:MAG: hypothetical protein ACTSYF_03590, partial [Promethearchaeota archaeon]